MDNNSWLPIINFHKCVGCGACVSHCPTQALAQQNGKAALHKPDQCIYCADCETLCPHHAIELPYLICREPNQ